MKKMWESRPFSSFVLAFSSTGTHRAAHGPSCTCVSQAHHSSGHQEGEALRYGERGTETLEHSSRCIKASYAGLIPWTSQITEQIMDLKDETTKMDAWLE